MDGFEEAQGGETLVVERLWAGEFQPPLTDLLLDARRLAVADGLERRRASPSENSVSA